MRALRPLAMEKDLRCDCRARGRGSLSTRWTGVHDTMERQHKSCRLSTVKGGERGRRRREDMREEMEKEGWRVILK